MGRGGYRRTDADSKSSSGSQAQCDSQGQPEPEPQVSKDDEFCVEIHEFCVENDEFCIEIGGCFVLKMMTQAKTVEVGLTFGLKVEDRCRQGQTQAGAERRAAPNAIAAPNAGMERGYAPNAFGSYAREAGRSLNLVGSAGN